MNFLIGGIDVMDRICFFRICKIVFFLLFEVLFVFWYRNGNSNDNIYICFGLFLV